MAFSVSSPFNAEEERRRKMQADLLAQSQSASSQAQGALGKMQSTLEAADKREYDRAQDALRRQDEMAKTQTATENDKRDYSLRLLDSNRANASRVENERQNTYARDAATKRNDELLRVSQAEEARKKTEREEDLGSLRLDDFVAGVQDDPDIPEGSFIEKAQRLPGQAGLTAEEFRGRRARVGKKLDVMDSQANRNNRVPQGRAGPKPVDPDVARKRAADARRAELKLAGEEKAAKDGAPPKDTAQQVNRRETLKQSIGTVDGALANLDAYLRKTSGDPLPSSGLGEGVRDLPGIRASPTLNPEERIRLKTQLNALNVSLFPILGRSDAPADREILQMADALVKSDLPDHVLRTRLQQLRTMMERALGGPAAGAPGMTMNERQKRIEELRKKREAAGG